ncbi:glycosyltransferase family 4 protein [Roseateles sp.]|uniref:glycosyltransferase family 4 protein n=1 Tax=Roseateles sp. TaxID=1971397 RepID=UPI003BACCA7C
MIRVGVSATSLNTPHLRGMGKYLLEMCSQARPEDGVAWTLFAQDARQRMHLPRHQQVVTDVFDHPGDRFALWEQVGLPRRIRRHGLDVLHWAENTMAWWQPCPAVVTIHDTLPWEMETTDRWQHWYWHTLMPAAFRRSAAVITISESSKRDILARWPALEPKLTVIPHGIEAAYFEPPQCALPAALSHALGGARYAVYLGGPMKRKRFDWAVQTLAAQPDPTLMLVACGFGADAREAARNALPHGLQGRVLFAEFLSDAELLALYRGAVAVLYPTLYEGFGFPAIEAQAAGTPVIFSPLGSLAELVGPLATLAPADDLAAWAAALHGAATLPLNARAEKASEARSWAQGFSWQQSWQKHQAVYLQVAQVSMSPRQPAAAR